MSKGPTVTQAYAMIRALKKRGAPGDGEKIKILEEQIEAEKEKQALLDIDKFFTDPPGKRK